MPCGLVFGRFCVYIHGNPWKSMEIHGNPWKSMEIRGNPRWYGSMFKCKVFYVR